MAYSANIVVNDLGMGGRGNFWTMAYSANIVNDKFGDEPWQNNLWTMMYMYLQYFNYCC